MGDRVKTPLTVLVPFPAGADLRVAEVSGVPLILVRRPDGAGAFLDNCPDEDKPLEPVLNRRGEIVCTQHGARFDCRGCLVDPGNAHHARSCEAGLLAVPAAVASADEVEVTITAELLRQSAEVDRRRRRRSYGRGPIGLLRRLRAWLRGES